MKNAKKVVYKIYLDNELWYEVYDDGTVNSVIDSKWGRPSSNDYWQQHIDFMERNGPESILMTQGFMVNDTYSRAFLAVCCLTCGAPNDEPPFDGYRVEYFGEGKPWEPALEEGAKM